MASETVGYHTLKANPLLVRLFPTEVKAFLVSGHDMNALNPAKASRYLIEFVIAFWMNSFLVAMYILGDENPHMALIFFALLCAGLICIVVMTRKRRVSAIIPKSLWLGVVILNLAIVFSYIVNAARYESSFMLGNMISSGLMFVTIYTIATRTETDIRVTLIIYCILSSGLLPFILLQGEMVWGRLIPRGLHPNFVGMIALICLIAALGVRSKLGAIGLSVLPIYTLWIVSSRTSLLVAGLAAMVTGWISLRRVSSGLFVFKWTVAAVVLACILTASALIGGPMSKATDYLGQHVFLIDDEHRGLESGGSGRSDLWAAALDLWMKNPVFGVGFKGHQLLMPEGMLAHNAYLGILADMGLCGLLGYLLTIGVPFYYLLRRNNALQDYTQRASIMLTFVVYGLLEPRGFGFGNPYSIIFFLVAFDSSKKPLPERTSPHLGGEASPYSSERFRISPGR